MLASVDQFGQQMAANAIDLGLEVAAGGPELKGWVTTPIKLVTK
jgi:ribose transport system substrate-binding protein